MRRLVLCAAWIGAATSCNQLLGSHDVVETPPDDARFFDAPIDAPYACPAIGAAPKFSQLLHQDVYQDCSSYSISAASQSAVGLCSDFQSANLRAIYVGALGAELRLDPAFAVPITDDVNDVKLSPEGDKAFAVVYHTDTLTYDIRTYDRAGDAWTRGADVAPSVASFVQITSPSRQPDRHLVRTGSDGQLHELVETASGWLEKTSYAANELGISAIDGVTMTGDGLRLLMIVPAGVTNQVMYTDRPSIDARFRPAELIDLPAVRNMFLTDDCSRVYVTGLSSIFHLQQR